MNTKSHHLLYMLSKVPDKRNPRGKRHPLSAILGLSVVAMLCGYRSYSAIAEWGRTYGSELAVALGFTHPKTPCASTLHYCFKDLDIDALENILGEWAASVLENMPDTLDKSGVSIDGKTLRGSRTQGAEITHLLSAVSHELGITLTQCAVSEKTNEIPMATQLLKTFDIEGKIITTDALLTQRFFCQQLCEAKADYVLIVRGNQATLLEDIRAVFKLVPSETHAASYPSKTFEQIQAELGAHTDTHTTCEKENGWIQTRTMTTSTALIDTAYAQWPGVAQIYEYKTERTHTRTGKKTQMTQYGITSLTPEQASAERLMTLRRGHDRELVPSHAGCGISRRCLTSPMWQHTPRLWQLYAMHSHAFTHDRKHGNSTHFAICGKPRRGTYTYRAGIDN